MSNKIKDELNNNLFSTKFTYCTKICKIVLIFFYFITLIEVENSINILEQKIIN